MDFKNARLEIACFNVESARIAQESGADRIELCDGFAVGGTTPSIEMVKGAKAAASIDLYVMIRPRGGDFVYTDTEFSQMKESIVQLKKEGADGFVFGILNADNTVNVSQNAQLVALAQPYPCTFHRAFDVVSDAFQSLEDIIECGFHAILTSGQQPNVMAGTNRLSELVEKAGGRITIMPGGGLRSQNLPILRQQTNANWYHSSAITEGKETADPIEIKTLKSLLND